jgi:Flp pilus assembly protein TadG
MDRKSEAAAKALRVNELAFMKREDGTIIIFTLVMLIAMFVLAGMGVDIMRYETTRTELQQTLDRSTLASASLTQDLEPEDVVRDYFAKAGLTDKLTKVVVTEGLNFRNVHAEAVADTNPIFLDLLDGAHEMRLDAVGASTAEQRITNVEIMLVLDVSGSMAGTKLSNLKSAASEFVDTVLAADGDGKISIGIVPYNGQVNLGDNLLASYNKQEDHNVANVNCIDLPSSVYSGLGLSTSLAMPVTGYVDTYSSSSYSSSYVSATNTSYSTPNTNNMWCPPKPENTVLPPTNNVNTLKTKINNLTAIGATSTNAGMKWGMALMDPGSRSVENQFIARGETPSVFSGRPFDYGADETMKVIVLMTDGEHFAEERLNNGYRSGNAPIYRSTGDGNYSIFIDRSGTTSDYWVPHLSTWKTAKWNSGSGVVQETWDDLWKRQRMTWVAWQLYARAYGNSSTVFYNTLDMFRTRTETTDMDTQLQTVCNRARDNNVIVYGIAFEAPAHGASQIEQCASTTAHYYNATGLEIQSAFRSIASNISQLRLTQ